MKTTLLEVLYLTASLNGLFYKMSLQKQTVAVPIVGGINTNVSSKNLSIPDFLELTNGRYLKDKKIDKRYGNKNLGLTVNTGTLNTPQALASIKDELLLLSSDKLYSFSDSLSTWYERGIISGATVNMEVATSSPVSASAVDVIVQDGIKVITWLESTTIYYSIFDIETGVAIVDRTTLVTSAGSIYPRLVSLSGNVYIFYNESTNLKAVRIPTANPTSPTTSTVYTTLDAAGGFDVSTTADSIFLLFCITATANLRISRLNTELTITATNTINSEDATNYKNMVCHGFYSSIAGVYYLGLGWVDATNNIRTTLYTTNLVQVYAPATIETLADVTSMIIAQVGDDIKYLYSVSAADTKNYYTKGTLVTLAGVIGTPAVVIRSAAIVSKAAYLNNTSYFTVLHDSSLQATYFTLLADGRVVAKYAPGESGTHATTKRVSNFSMLDATSFIWGALKRGRIQSDNAALFASQSPYFATLNLDPAKAYLTTRFNDNLLVSGGLLLSYDGKSVSEYGFHLYPEDVTVAQSGAGTPIPVGTYLVYAIYEWTDNRGNRMQSAPSIAKSITTNGTASQIDVVVPALRITDKSSNATYSTRAATVVRVFITEAAGVIPYYMAQADNPNLLSTDSVTISITSLTGLTTHEILYTSGGQLENIGAPAHKFALTHDNRIFLLGLEDSNAVQFSKDIKPLTGTGFNEDLKINLDPFGGEIVAGASIDTSLVVFKETATYIISGTGPNDLGQGSSYNPPQLIASDIGCQDPKSILVTPDGVIWKSNKGIYLMTRNFALTPIGKPVSDYDSAVILSSDILTDSDEIRFVTNANVTLVYNYHFKRWSVYTTFGALDATTWKNSSYVYLTSTKALQEDSTTYLDDGSYVPLTIRTGWVNFAKLQGYQRLYKLSILGTYYTNHRFQLTFFYNYSDIPKETINVSASSIVNTSVYGDSETFGDDPFFGGSDLDEVYQLRVDNPQQVCESMSIKLVDTQTGSALTTGQGFSLEGLMFEVGLKSGTFRNRASRSF